MADLQKIQRDWEAIEQTPFPAEHRGKSIGGLNLTLLESEAGGLIMAYLQTQGSYGARQLYYVREVSQNLQKVIAELDGQAKTYFQRIHSLLKTIIADLPEGER